MPATQGNEIAKYNIHDRDFVVNGVWEGAGDELHSNELYAAKTEFGARIIAGLALTCLSVCRHTAARDWTPPKRFELSFESAVKAGDEIQIETSHMSDDTNIDVSVGERTALKISDKAVAAPCPSRSDTCDITKARTFTQGDRDLFDWWVGTSFPGLKVAPEGIVPWPLLASAISGFISRIDLVKTPHLSLVNRSNVWQYYRPVKIGETIHAEVHNPRERISKSRPGWGIWSGDVIAVSDNEGDIVASIEWTCMFTFAVGDEQ